MTTPTPGQMVPLLAAAFAARSELLTRLHAEPTDAYRLFHGTAEGRPGLTVDRYGGLLLAQSFHQSLAPEDLAALESYYAGVLPGLTLVYNDRSRAHSRIVNELSPEQLTIAQMPRETREMGVAYRIQARHEGQDPWLFLDLRAGRRYVMRHARDKSLLNLFAYTCGVGIAAARAGARFVMNVDFAESSLKVGRVTPKARSASSTWSTTIRRCSSRRCCAPPRAARWSAATTSPKWIAMPGSTRSSAARARQGAPSARSNGSSPRPISPAPTASRR